MHQKFILRCNEGSPEANITLVLFFIQKINKNHMLHSLFISLLVIGFISPGNLNYVVSRQLFSPLSVNDNRSSLEWFVRRVQDRISLFSLRRYVVKSANTSRSVIIRTSCFIETLHFKIVQFHLTLAV